MADVFISYSRKDKSFVERLHANLKAQGRDVWVDWEDIPLTADWWHEICSGIEAADTFIFIITPDSVASPVCNMEIDHATRHNKRLVPIVRIPADEKVLYSTLTQREIDEGIRKMLAGRQLVDVAKENWQALARHNWLFFEDEARFEANFSKLVSAIDTDLDYVRDHTRLTLRAREWELKTRNDSILLRGDDLLTAEAWLTQAVGKEPAPTPLHAEFIAESRQAENLRQEQALEQQKRELALQTQSARRLRYLLAAMFVFLILALGLMVFAFDQRRQALENEAAAVTAQSAAVAAQATAERRANEADSVALAEQAQIVAGNNPFLAYTLGLHAASILNPPPRAVEVLSSLAYDAGAIRALIGHTQAVREIAYSADGQRALTIDLGTSATIWDVTNGTALRQFSIVVPTLTPSFSGITAFAFSRDLRRTLVGYWDGSITMIDTDLDSRNFGLPMITMSGDVTGVISLALSPDGQMALSGGNSGALVLWDMNPESENFGTPIKSFNEHTNTIYSVGFSADGRRAVSASESTIVVWNMDTVSRGFTRPVRSFIEIENIVSHAVISPDGAWVLSAGFNGSVTLWNVQRGKEQWTADPDAGSVTSISFSPNGISALIGTDSGRLLLWSTDPVSSSYGTLLREFNGHNSAVTSVAYNPNGEAALSGSQDGNIILWDLSEVGQLSNVAGFNTINGVVFSPDGRRALTTSQDFTLAMWDMDETSETFATIRQVVNTQNYQGYPTASALSPDGWHVLTGACDSIDDEGFCNGGDLMLWDVATAIPVWRVAANSNTITAIAFSPNGQLALSGSCAAFDNETADCTRGEMVLINVITGETIRTFTAHTDNILAIGFSPDGVHALSYAADNTLILWDINSETSLFTFDSFENQIRNFAYNPDGLSVLLGAENGSLTLWDANPDSPALGSLQRAFTGHSQRVTSLAFSPNGAQVLSGARDGSLILWDVASGDALRIFPRYNQAVIGIGFSPDGRRAFVSDGYNAILWRIDSSLPELIAWLYDNRFVDNDVSCNQREQFGFEPPCDEQGNAPTITPFPTLAPLTATPTFTPSPTVDTTQTTLTPTMTVTATFVPTPTPAQGGLAVFGTQCGFVPVAGSQTWEFRAQAGDLVTISVNGTCASLAESQIPFDTTVTIFAPDGTQFAFNDDRAQGDLNSQINDLLLPVAGTYQISVSSYNVSGGGNYTLVIIPAGITPTPTLTPSPTAGITTATPAP